MSGLTEAADEDTEKLEMRITLSLIYIAAVMLVYAYKRLQSNIKRVFAASEPRNKLSARVNINITYTTILFKNIISRYKEINVFYNIFIGVNYELN